MPGKRGIIEIINILDTIKYIDGLKAIVFDLDDTLYSEKEYIRSGYQKITELFPELEDAEKKLWNLFLEGKPAIDDFLKGENLYTQELHETCLKVYHFQKPEIHLYDGVKEMLEELKKHTRLV